MVEVAWIPGWYELDPLLEIGATGHFAFWKTVPEHLHDREEIVLYNTIAHPEDMLVASGTIHAIRHPDFGAIRKVDTRGLDYTIILENGTKFMVNAEEEPGKLFERYGEQWRASERTIMDWRFVVVFQSLTELRPMP